MKRCRNRNSRMMATVCCVALLMAASGTALTAFAQTAELPRRAAPASPVIASVKTGPATISLKATQVAIPTQGAFDYTAVVRTGVPLEYLQVRMRLHGPGGRLIYQKTFVDQSDATGSRSFSFERQIGDIGLEPGVYPTELSIRVAAGGKTSDETLEGSLLVFDPETRVRPVALVARVAALPLTDADGRFVVDPATYVRARDDVLRLSDYVLGDESARLSVSLSPLMLEEWRQVAGGYRFESPEGPVDVAVGDETAQSYAYTLQRLREAGETGRLEVLSAGYSDPDLSQLEVAGLLEDVEPQYDEGASAIFRSIGATASVGTAPANGCFSEQAARELTEVDIDYAFVSDECVPLVAPGAYAAQNASLTVLVSDEAQVSLLASGTTHAVMAGIFSRYLEDGPGPVPLVVPVGPGGVSLERVISLGRSLSRQPWTELVLGRSVLESPGKLPAAQLNRSKGPEAPAGHWETIAQARSLAGAVVASLGAQDEEALLAERGSLTAEASAWTGVQDDWTHSDRALAFASKARTAAETVLGRVTVAARPVTLAGSRGEVPITIANSGEKVMRVRVLTTPSGPMRQDLSPALEIDLQPQDNFIEVPVDLQGALSGDLAVVVMAGDVQIAETTVPLKASIMDRLVILGGIVVLLGGLLAFIITRVRAADRQQDDARVTH